MSSSSNTTIPNARVKRIAKLDKDITRLTSESIHLISSATEMFLQFLAEKSSNVATEKKKRTIKLDHLRLAVKRHRPCSQFLLDSLPPAPLSSDRGVVPADRTARKEKGKGKMKEGAANANTRRIDSFFTKKKESDSESEDELEEEGNLGNVDEEEDEDEVVVVVEG